MNVDIRDVYHYYMGCRFRFTWPDGDYVEDVLDTCGFVCGNNLLKKDEWYEIDLRDDDPGSKFQLYLTHIGDMTQQQEDEYYKLTKKVGDKIVDTPMSLDYLFKNGFDAFGLLEADQALNIKTLPCACQKTGCTKQLS